MNGDTARLEARATSCLHAVSDEAGLSPLCYNQPCD